MIPARATGCAAGGGVGLAGAEVGLAAGEALGVAVGVAPSPGVGVAEWAGVGLPGEFGVGLEALCAVGLDVAFEDGDEVAPGVGLATDATSGLGVGLEAAVCRTTTLAWERRGPK